MKNNATWWNYSNLSPGAMLFMKLVQCTQLIKITAQPWLVWLSGLSASLQTKGLQFDSRSKAHACVVGQGPIAGCVRGNHTLMFSFSSPVSSLKINHNPPPQNPTSFTFSQYDQCQGVQLF